MRATSLILCVVALFAGLANWAGFQHWLEQAIEHVIAVGGPVVIFGLLFACGLGLPLPEDIPLTIGGFFAAKGQMHLVAVAILGWLGIIGGDCVLYHLGKKYGLNITKVPFVGRHLTRPRILKAEKLFERYGVLVVAVGRLFAGIRGAMVVAAGATRFNFVKFLIADGLAALVSGGLFVALGFWLGRKLESMADVRHSIEPYKHWVFVGMLGLAVLTIAYMLWRGTRHKPMAEVAAENIIATTPPPARDEGGAMASE